MRAHDRKKQYRVWCARQIRRGLIPSSSTGLWGGAGGVPQTTVGHLRAGCHPGAKRKGD